MGKNITVLGTLVLVAIWVFVAAIEEGSTGVASILYCIGGLLVVSGIVHLYQWIKYR